MAWIAWNGLKATACLETYKCIFYTSAFLQKVLNILHTAIQDVTI